MKEIKTLNELTSFQLEIYNKYESNIEHYNCPSDAFEAGIEAALLTLYPGVNPFSKKENTIDVLKRKGYNVVFENEKGISFVNEDVKLCVIYLKMFDDDLLFYKSPLREALDNKFKFAEKGTICLFENSHEEIEDVEKELFYALRFHVKNIDVIPSSCNKNKKVKFINHSNLGTVNRSKYESFHINPFKPMDGKFAKFYYQFLTELNSSDLDGLVVYPEVLSDEQISWLKYVCNKLYSVKI